MSDNTGPVDPKAELTAMQAVAEALRTLDSATAARVLRWATESHGLTNVRAPEPRSLDPAPSGRALPQFETLAELHAAASPTTEADKALVAAYWFQVVEGADSFGSQQVNTALKNLGHGVSNITIAFDRLKAHKPAFVIQLKKAGTSMQARKTFRVTSSGQRAVEQMIEQASLSE